MCLAIPARVTEILADDQVRVAQGGLPMNVSIELLGDSVQAGNYLIVHAGFAIGKLDPVKAEHTLALFATMGSMPDDPATWR